MPAATAGLDAIATPRPITVEPDNALAAAAKLMDEKGFRHLPVVHQKRLCGMVSERDLLQALGDFHGRSDHSSKWRPDVAHVKDVMSTPVFALERNAGVSDAARVLASRKFGAIPIADNRGRPQAIVTESDLLEYYAQIRRDAGVDTDYLVGRLQDELITVSADDPVATAVSHFFQRNMRHLPVIADDALVGLISDRDVRRVVGDSCSPEHALQRPIREVMSQKPITARPDFTLHEAAAMMHQLKVSALPVIEGPELLGIVTVTDVLKHLAEVTGGERLGSVHVMRCSLRDGSVIVEHTSIN